MEGEKKGENFLSARLGLWTLDFIRLKKIFQPCFSGKSVYSIGMTKNLKINANNNPEEILP